MLELSSSLPTQTIPTVIENIDEDCKTTVSMISHIHGRRCSEQKCPKNDQPVSSITQPADRALNVRNHRKIHDTAMTKPETNDTADETVITTTEQPCPTRRASLASTASTDSYQSDEAARNVDGLAHGVVEHGRN